MKNNLKIGLLALLSVFTFEAFALDFVYTKNSFFGQGSEGNEYAIEGYDAVNYFTENKPAKGDEQFSFNYKGKQWHFKNQKHLDLFSANPQKYAPQYGGHCAWRMGIDGKGVYGNANIWTIVDGKLYLNYNNEVKRRWVKDIPGFIKKADGFWLGKNQFKSLN